MTSIRLIAVFVIIALGKSCFALETPTTERKYIIELPTFDSTDAKNVDEKVNEALTRYNEVIDDLINQLSKKNLTNESKVYCIYMLGNLRAVKALSILIEEIDTEAIKMDSKIKYPRWGKHPAQEALTKLGKPAVNMILEKLSTEKTEKRRQQMCIVILDVEGKEIGSMRIKKLIEKETSSEGKVNLEQALKLIE